MNHLRVVPAPPLPARIAPFDAEGINLAMLEQFRPFGMRRQYDAAFENETGFELVGAGPTEAERAAAMCQLEATLLPCADGVLRQAIAKLRAGTILLRDSTADDRVMRLQLIADAIAGYPSDVVADACNRQLAESRFLPVPAELVERCEHLVRPRRRMLAALKRPRQLETPEPPPRTPPSQHEKDYVTLILARLPHQRIAEIGAALTRFEPQTDVERGLVSESRARLRAMADDGPARDAQ
jgi:hypothetical protein